MFIKTLNVKVYWANIETIKAHEILQRKGGEQKLQGIETKKMWQILPRPSWKNFYQILPQIFKNNSNDPKCLQK